MELWTEKLQIIRIEVLAQTRALGLAVSVFCDDLDRLSELIN